MPITYYTKQYPIVSRRDLLLLLAGLAIIAVLVSASYAAAHPPPAIVTCLDPAGEGTRWAYRL